MSRSANRGLALVVGAVVIVIIGLAVVSASWRVPERDPKSPAGVVQAYFQAVFDHRSAEAAALLDPVTRCTAANFDRAGYDYSARVDLVESTIRGKSATVRVNIQHESGDPFGGTWSEPQVFQLLANGDSWRITGQPWPVWVCDQLVVKP